MVKDRTLLLCLMLTIRVLTVNVPVVYADEKAQQSDPEKLMEALMSQHRNQDIVSIRSDELVKSYGIKLMPSIEQYLKDPSERVRWTACVLLWQLRKHDSTSPAERQHIVYLLVERLNDSSGLVHQAAPNRLLDFSAADFSEASKNLLKNFLTERLEKKAEVRDIVLVVGVANMKTELSVLEGLLIDETQYEKKPHAGVWYGTTGWAARKARARMGVEKDIHRCIKLVTSEPDPIVRYAILFDDLQYVRQPQIIPVLSKYLHSPEPSLVVESDSVLLPARYWAVGALAKILQDFPIKKDAELLYREEDIEVCRNWMLAQKKWKIIR